MSSFLTGLGLGIFMDSFSPSVSVRNVSALKKKVPKKSCRDSTKKRKAVLGTSDHS